MPIIEEPKSPVCNYIYNQVYKENRDFRILMTGAVGTGKSFTSLRIAEIFDPEFDCRKQVIFTKEEFNQALEHFKNLRKEIMESDLTPEEKQKRLTKEVRGKVLIVDESGVVADSVNHMNKDVKDIKYNLQSIRYLGLILVFNLPIASHFLKAGRQLMDMYCQTARPPSRSLRQSYVKVYIYKKNLFTKEGRELKKFTYTTEDGFPEEVGIWILSKPSRKYWQPYERYSHMRKDQIANENNTKEFENNLKQDRLSNLLLYNYENKVQSVKELAEILETSESSIRKYINTARVNLKKLHNLKSKNFDIY